MNNAHSPILLSASILSADFSQLGQQIAAVESAGVDWIHVDVMDGHFVPNLSMGPFIVETVRRLTQKPIDVHLMVNNPETMIEWFAQAGADRISIQIEASAHSYHLLNHIRELGCLPGIVLNPGTPAAALEAVLPLADMVLVMTVNPGYSGQAFLPDMVQKIAQVRERIAADGLSTRIQVDGGITSATLPQTYQAGARVFVSATSIFRYPQGIAAGVSALRASVVNS